MKTFEITEEELTAFVTEAVLAATKKLYPTFERLDEATEECDPAVYEYGMSVARKRVQEMRDEVGDEDIFESVMEDTAYDAEIPGVSKNGNYL